MRLLLLVPTVYAAAVLETSLADAISVGPLTPDLLALVAVAWILVTPGRWAFLAAGAIGLAADLVSPGRLGVGMASFLVVGYLLAKLRAKFEMDHLVWQVPAVWVATSLAALGPAVASWLWGETSVPLPTLLVRAAGVGVYTTGVGLPVLMVLGWIREPFRARRRKLAGF
jgi:rod shape-determining protein MreD